MIAACFIIFSLSVIDSRLQLRLFFIGTINRESEKPYQYAYIDRPRLSKYSRLRIEIVESIDTLSLTSEAWHLNAVEG